MRKILITGASGFFGQALLHELIKSDEHYECYCVYHSKKTDISDNRLKWVQADCLDKIQINKIIAEFKPTHCVHLAWYVEPEKFWNAHENIDWLYSSFHLFDVFCKNGGRFFLGAGTLAEYDWASGVLDEETTPLIPATLYGQCKHNLHEIIRKWRDVHYQHVKILWPRIGYFFGPGEPKDKLISKLINSLKNDQVIHLASPEFSRPYAHIKYWGGALAQIILDFPRNDVTFNMSSSKNYSLKKIVSHIEKQKNMTSELIQFNAYPANPLYLKVHNRILRETLKQNINDTFFHDLNFLMESNNDTQ